MSTTPISLYELPSYSSLAYTDYLKDQDDALDHQIKGEAIVYTKEDRLPVHITIRLANESDGIKKFTAYANCDGVTTPLGHANIEWLRSLPNGNFGNEIMGNITDTSDLYDYGQEKTCEKVSKIFVEYIESSHKYLGEGKALMQAIMEYSYMKGCEGRVMLDANWDSHGFYYGLGMRTDDVEIDAKIKDIYLKYKKTHQLQEFTHVYMYLYQDAVQTWKTQINTNPVLRIVGQI